MLYRILQSPCNKSLTSIEVTFLYDSIWISEGIVLPNMELLRMFDLRGFCQTYNLYRSTFFPGEDPVAGITFQQGITFFFSFLDLPKWSNQLCSKSME